MQALEALRRRPVTVTAETTCQQVAKEMATYAVGAVVVVDDDGLPLGVATDRDLVVRGMANGYVDARVDAVMSTDVVTVEGSADLRSVIRLFGTEPVRRVVLVTEGRVAGLLSVDDLVIDLVADLADVIKPITAEVLFGHVDPPVPVVAGGAS